MANRDILDSSYSIAPEDNPERAAVFYLYKVMNFTDINQILSVPSRRTFLHIVDPKTYFTTLDHIEHNPTINSSVSFQKPGTQKLSNLKSAQMIVDKALPDDFEDCLYIWSMTLYTDSVIVSPKDCFIGKMVATNWSHDNNAKYKNIKESKFRYIFDLLNLENFATASESSISFLADPKHLIDYFDGSKEIEFENDGLLGSITENVSIDNRQTFQDLTLNQTGKYYALINLLINKTSPTLVAYSPTFDENKKLRWDMARAYFGNKTKLNDLWASKHSDAMARSNNYGLLYWAVHTILYLAQARKNNFKDLIIDNPNSPNYLKTDISSLTGIYGLNPANIQAQSQQDITDIILATFEDEVASALETDDDLKLIYQNVKALLANMGQDVPSKFAYGSYNEENKLTSDWYFKATTIIPMPQGSYNSANVEIKLQAFSLKYKTHTTADINATKITGLKDEWLSMGDKSFNLDAKVALNNFPTNFTEQTFSTKAGSTDISSSAYLGYYFYLQLNSADSYDHFFGEVNPFHFTFSKRQNSNSLFSETNFPDSYILNYLEENWIALGMKYVPNSIHITSTSDTTTGNGHYEIKMSDGSENGYQHPFTPIRVWIPAPDTTTYHYSITWEEEPIGPALPKIQQPHFINQQTLDSIFNQFSPGLNKYTLTPQINFGSGSIRKIREIVYHTAFTNKVILKLWVVLKDGTSRQQTFEYENGFNDDQTICEGGIRI